MFDKSRSKEGESSRSLRGVQCGRGRGLDHQCVCLGLREASSSLLNQPSCVDSVLLTAQLWKERESILKLARVLEKYRPSVDTTDEPHGTRDVTAS